uniref:Uncharacterized protein n=1 Tax=Cacopsylla melanoneura TaxID=428564 RepID=A0A8D8WRQ0_9HEMI
MSAENFTIRNVFGDLTHQRFTNDRQLPYMIIRGSKIFCSDNTIDLTRFYDMEFMVLLTNQNGTGSNANFLTSIARLFFDSDKTTNIVIKNYLYSERSTEQSVYIFFNFCIVYLFPMFFGYGGHILNYRAL